MLNEGIAEIGHVQYEIEGEIYFLSGMKAAGDTIYSVQLRPFHEPKEADYIPLEEKSCITV